MKLFDLFTKKSLPSHLQTGIFGERKAAAYLRKKGYRILERNFSSHGKEIDIIAENRNSLVFCEVKTRRTNEALMEKYGRPSDAVNYYKQKNVISGAKIYLSYNKTDKNVRFDVIEVYLKESKKNHPKVLEIKHIENAFRNK
jgi:putative endonuclease